MLALKRRLNEFVEMEIYYFSGTGNSLYIAKEMKKRFPEAILIPIIGILKNKEIKAKAKIVGIIFPIHAFTFPWPVKKFLQMIDLRQTSYIYAIATRVCFIKVFSDINKLLKKQKKALDAYFSFEMPENYIPLFDVYPMDKIVKTELEAKKKLDSIADIVKKRETKQSKNRKRWFLFSHILYPIITTWFQKIRFPDMGRSFYIDSNCMGCGTCEKVCLSNKIRISDNRPYWLPEIKCTYCFACIHYCPCRAIQLKNRKTLKRGRYHHSAITVKDIMEQKRY